MQLTCPHCGKEITAEHINIQRMAAVCPNCHTVFGFDPSDARVKRRKVKQPEPIASDESSDHLTLDFRTNFRLDKNENFLASAGLSLAFTFITALLVSQSLSKPMSALIPLGFVLFTLILYYWSALIAYNRTHVEVSDTEIKVSRKPLPNFLNPSQTINLAGVDRIRYEETPASKKEGYDMPRYHVWADVVDGNRRLIVGDVIEDYAVFLLQRLNEFLDLEPTPDASRLQDAEQPSDDGQIADELIDQSEASQNTHS